MPTDAPPAASNKRGVGENLVDLALFLLVTLPFILILLTSAFCSGWNEGSMAGTCTIPALDGLYNTLMGLLLLLAFGGFLIVGPVILVLAVISLVRKMFRYARGGKPSGVKTALYDLVTFAPIAGVAYLLLRIFVRF